MGSVRTEEQFIERWKSLKNSDWISSRRKASALAYYIGARDFELPELKLLVDAGSVF